MELRRYALLLWRWLWLIVLGALLAAGAAFLTSRNMTPVYSAATLLMISPSKAQVLDTTSYQPMSDRLAATYVEMLVRQPVLEAVIEHLRLPLTVGQLQRAISVAPIRNTQLIQLSVQDPDPERAAQIANQAPIIFIEQNDALQARRYADSKASLQRQIAGTQATIAALQDEIKKIEAAADRDENQLDRLRRDVQTQQGSYASLARSFEDLRLEEAKQLDTLLVTEAARAPRTPIRPRTLQNTALASLIGALLAFGVACLLEYLDDVLRNPEQVKAALGLTTLGVTPVAEGRDGDPEHTVLNRAQSPLAEAYRALRTNLQFVSIDRPLRTLVVTSASPNEGKSVVSVNLAAAIARSGRRVILVDCDLHRPRQHTLLNVPDEVGLTTGLIETDANPLDLLQETSVAGLQVLPTGPLPPNPAEILSSGRMRTLLAVLTQEADLVLLDSPPLLAVVDSVILATEADGVLMVVDAASTRRETARRALTSLEQVHARVVGAVLNRAPRVQSGYAYYFGGSYHGQDSAGEQNNGPRRRRRWPALRIS